MSLSEKIPNRREVIDNNEGSENETEAVQPDKLAPEQDSIRDDIVRELNLGHLNEAKIKAIKQAGFSGNILELEGIGRAATNGIERDLLIRDEASQYDIKSSIDSALSIKNNLNLPEEIFLGSIQSVLSTYLLGGGGYELKNFLLIKDGLKISDEAYSRLLRNIVYDSLQSPYGSNIIVYLKHNENLPAIEKLFEEKELKAVALKSAINTIKDYNSDYNVRNTLKIIEEFDLKNEIANSKEFSEAVTDCVQHMHLVVNRLIEQDKKDIHSYGIGHSLMDNYALTAAINKIVSFSENFNVSYQEFRNEAKNLLEATCIYGKTEKIDYLAGQCLSEEEISQAVFDRIQDGGGARKIDELLKIALKYHLPDDKIRQIGKNLLLSGKYSKEYYQEIKQTFRLAETDFESAGREIFVKLLKLRRIDELPRLLKDFEEFGLASEFLQGVGRAEVIKILERDDIENAVLAADLFGLTPETLRFEPIQQQLEEKLAEYLKFDDSRWLDGFDDIIKKFHLSSEAIARAAKGAAVERLKSDDLQKIPYILQRFKLPSESLSFDEFQKIAEEKIIQYLISAFEKDLELSRIFDFSAEYINSKVTQESAIQGVVKYMQSGAFAMANEIAEFFKFSEETIKSNAVNCLERHIASSRFDSLEGLISEYGLSDVDIRQAGEKAMISTLVADSADKAGKIAQKYGFSENIFDYYDQLLPYQKSIIDVFNLGTVGELSDFQYWNRDFIDFLSDTPSEAMSLENRDLDVLNSLQLKLQESEQLKRNGVDLGILEKSKDKGLLFEKLTVYCDDWKDTANIGGPFKRGSEIFGMEKMFDYLYNDVARHDGLHAFDRIIGMYKASGLSAKAFYSNILQQVSRDSSIYEAGSSYHHLNQLAQTLDTDFDKILRQAENYQGIDQLQPLAKEFSSPQKIFANWNNLKRYASLTELLQRSEVLSQLQELKDSGNLKLYKYIETLVFHRSSKVEMSKVIEFWRDPLRFLSANDVHTPEKLQERKKPSNYVEIPKLDLRANELRDALIEEKMDGIQAFRPMEIEYSFRINEAYPLPLVEKIKLALGSFKEKIHGKVKDPKKLYEGLQNIFKTNGLSFQDYLAGADLPKDKSDVMEKAMMELLEDKQIGLPQAGNEQVFIAKINKKSDPTGVLAGNDTVCCMPFGSGKNNVYTFNPNTSLFTLQIKRPDGELRTIAQSVLTKDMDVQVLLLDIMKKMDEVGEDINQILPDSVLKQGRAYLACDNVEVAENFKTQEYSEIIEKIYHDFFAEYMARFAAEDNLVDDQVVVGVGYSSTLTHLPTKPNTFLPLAPVSYSDKYPKDSTDETQNKVYYFDLKQKMPLLDRSVSIPEIERNSEVPLPKITGLSYLTFQDSVPVAYLEGKAYNDNKSLLVNLHNMENGLIAKDINNRAKNRPNMSLKYNDRDGKMRSYILAYEGRTGRQWWEADEDESDEAYSEIRRREGERIIYISDLASDKKSPFASGKLINGFIELYRRNYLEKGDLIPIFAEAREQTSYALIKNHLDNVAKELKIRFDLDELSDYQNGPDTMHRVMIRPSRT